MHLDNNGSTVRIVGHGNAFECVTCIGKINTVTACERKRRGTSCIAVDRYGRVVHGRHIWSMSQSETCSVLKKNFTIWTLLAPKNTHIEAELWRGKRMIVSA
jgi:hypothetical protein